MVVRRKVEGRYVNGLRRATGRVTFRPSSTFHDTVSGALLTDSPIVAHLVKGEFAIDLWATDDPGVLPGNRWYTVREELAGWPGREFTMSLPAEEFPVDLVDYVPANPDPAPDPEFVSLTLGSLLDVDLSMVPKVDGRYRLGGPYPGPDPGGTTGSTRWWVGEGDPPDFIEGAALGDIYLNRLDGSFYQLT